MEIVTGYEKFKYYKLKRHVSTLIDQEINLNNYEILTLAIGCFLFFSGCIGYWKFSKSFQKRKTDNS